MVRDSFKKQFVDAAYFTDICNFFDSKKRSLEGAMLGARDSFALAKASGEVNAIMSIILILKKMKEEVKDGRGR